MPSMVPKRAREHSGYAVAAPRRPRAKGDADRWHDLAGGRIGQTEFDFIPQAQRQAAMRFGKLIAQRLLSFEEVSPQLIKAIEKQRVISPEGVRTRVAWMLRDAIDYWNGQARRARWTIKTTIEPMMDVRASANALLRAAHSSNSTLGAPLMRHEVVTVVDDCCGAWIRRHAKGRRHGR